MEYHKIGKEERKYICKETYKRAPKWQKAVYYLGIRTVVNDIKAMKQDPMGSNNSDESDTFSDQSVSDDEMDEESIHFIISETTKALENSPKYITFVGMRYFGDHIFSYRDNVRLEREDDNFLDPTAIKVLVKKKEEWIHVAYVTKNDAKYLRTIDDFEQKSIVFYGNIDNSSLFTINF